MGRVSRESIATDWLTSSPSHHASLSKLEVYPASQGMMQLLIPSTSGYGEDTLLQQRHSSRVNELTL